MPRVREIVFRQTGHLQYKMSVNSILQAIFRVASRSPSILPC